MGTNGQQLGVVGKEEQEHRIVKVDVATSLGTVVALAVVMFAIAAPFGWLLMLFLGNLGVGIGFWGALPGGALIAALFAAGARS